MNCPNAHIQNKFVLFAYEAAQELITALGAVINEDSESGFLGITEFESLYDLRNVLTEKVGRSE